MVAIIRLATTQTGWSFNMMKRIERAYNGFKPKEVIFHPDYSLDTGLVFNPKDISFMYRSNLHMEELQSLDVKKIIFLEPLQDPYSQLIEARWNVQFETHIHTNPFYGGFNQRDQWAYMREITLPRLITQRPVVAQILGQSFPNIQVRAIGGFLEKFSVKTSHAGLSIMWAGHRINDMAKGYDIFMQIVRSYPGIRFVACLNKYLTSQEKPENLTVFAGLNSEEYLGICKMCSHVISTSRVENFSYQLFDAMSMGLIPLVPDNMWFQDFPEKFRYNPVNKIKFNLDVDMEEIEQIVEPHFYENTFQRLIDPYNTVPIEVRA